MNYFDNYIKEHPEIQSPIYLLKLFEESKAKGEKIYHWNVIPAKQYYNCLKDFAENGEFMRFPKRILRSWIDLICHNVVVFEYFNWFTFFSENSYYNTCFEDKYPKVNDLNEVIIKSIISFFNLNYDIDKLQNKYEELMSLHYKLVKKIYNNDYGNNKDNLSKEELKELKEKDFLIFKEAGKNNIFDILKGYLRDIGYDNWAKTNDGCDIFSDTYYEDSIKYPYILRSLSLEPTKEQMVVAINRCIDIAHERYDLAEMFLEGGNATATKISNGTLARIIFKPSDIDILLSSIIY